MASRQSGEHPERVDGIAAYDGPLPHSRVRLLLEKSDTVDVGWTTARLPSWAGWLARPEAEQELDGVTAAGRFDTVTPPSAVPSVVAEREEETLTYTVTVDWPVTSSRWARRHERYDGDIRLDTVDEMDRLLDGRAVTGEPYPLPADRAGAVVGRLLEGLRRVDAEEELAVFDETLGSAHAEQAYDSGDEAAAAWRQASRDTPIGGAAARLERTDDGRYRCEVVADTGDDGRAMDAEALFARDTAFTYRGMLPDDADPARYVPDRL